MSTLDSNPRHSKKFISLHVERNRGRGRRIRPLGYFATRRDRCFKLYYKYQSC